MYGPNLRS